MKIKITPRLVEFIGGILLGLGVLMIVLFKGGGAFPMFLIILGALGIGLGGLWENMKKEKKKKGIKDYGLEINK